MDGLLILHMQDEIGFIPSGENAVSFFHPLGTEAQAGLRSGTVSKNTLYAVGAYSGMLYTFKLPQFTLACCRSCVGRYPFKVELKNSSLYIACADSDTVHMLSPSSGEQLSSFRTGGYLTAMAVSPKYCLLCTANTRKIFLLAANQLYPIYEMNLPVLPSCALYDEEKDIFYICGTAEDGVKGSLCLLSGEGELIKICDTGNIPVDMAFYRGLLLISCSGQDVIALHARNNGRTMGWIKGPIMPDRLAVCSERGLLYVSSQLEDVIEIIDLAGRKTLYTIQTGREPSALIICR